MSKLAGVISRRSGDVMEPRIDYGKTVPEALAAMLVSKSTSIGPDSIDVSSNWRSCARRSSTAARTAPTCTRRLPGRKAKLSSAGTFELDPRPSVEDATQSAGAKAIAEMMLGR